MFHDKLFNCCGRVIREQIYITCICLDLNLFCLLRRVSFYQC